MDLRYPIHNHANVTQCDLVQPVCGQCKRVNRQCHGYRDTRGLRITDMSAVVAKKAKKQILPDRGQQSRKHLSEIGTPTAASNTFPDSISVLGRPNPTDTIEELAFGFFHFQYVVGNSCPFKYIEPIYNNMGLPLVMSIRAVGLASLSKAHRSTDLETRARFYYISAIRLINEALGTPQATTESTMSAILLLDQWDKIIPPVHRSKQACINHLNGVMALMKLRGSQQFTTKTGLEMFVHMRAHLFITCLQHELPIPTNYLSLHAFASNYFDNISHEMAEVTIRFVTLFTQLRDGTLFGTERIIKSANHADQEVASLIAKISPDSNCKVVPLSFSSDLVYESHYHLHRDPTIGKVLNQLQAARVALLDLILQQAVSSRDSLPLASRNTVQTAEEQFVYVIGGICASVPQQVGYLPLLDAKPTSVSPSTARQPSIPGSPRVKIEKAYVQSANVLLWPLFIVANSQNCPERARTWIKSQFHIIGKTLGLDRALEAVAMLESGGHAKIWDSYWYVESISYLDDGSSCYGDDVDPSSASPPSAITQSKPPSGRRVVFPCMALYPFVFLD